MASCGPPPPRAAATPAAAATAEHVLLQHPVLLQYALLQHPLSSNDNASTSSDILAAASHATAAAVHIPGSTSTHMKVNVAATFGQKVSPVWAYFTMLHRRFRPRDEPGQERQAACIAETARSVACTTKTLIRHLHKASYYILHPKRFARNASYENNVAVLGGTQAHPKKS